MTKRIQTTLEAKLFILTIGTIFIVLLGVGHLAMNQYRSVIMEQKRTEFDAIAHTLALSTPQIVQGKDQHLMNTISSQVKSSRMNLEYIVIADHEGHTLYAESKNLPKKPYAAGMRWWMVVRRIMGYGNIDPENITSVSVPAQVAPNSIGRLTVGFTLNKVHEEIDSVQAKALLALSLGLLLGIIYATILGKAVSASLQSLLKAARAVSAGNFGCRVTSKAVKEVDELAHAFNYMVDSLADNHEQLIERANTDSLTGLHNHRYFQERLSLETSRAERYEHDLSLLMIDIDFFKTYNDTQGHPTGDAALRNLAQIMLRSIRSTDVAVRYGGEEFAIILPETTMQEAAATADRIRQAVEQEGLSDDTKEPVQLTISIGVATYPDHGIDKQSLISAADTALYQAKAQGRNRVSVFDSSMGEIDAADPYKLCVLLHAQDMKTIEALSGAVDAKLKFPTGHSKAIATLAETTAKRMGLSDSECSGIYLAGLLRDVGQISVPESILAKTDALTDQEMKVVRTHSTLGHSIVQQAPRMSSMLPAILHHHERYDGTGYPSGLSGENIPIAARILAVADAYQSMITLRPHRRQLTTEEAVTELIDNTSSQFDPGVVKATLSVLADTGYNTQQQAA